MFEYKIKTVEDVGTDWENLPMFITDSFEDVQEAAKLPKVWEVRWNRPGLLQGHYIQGSKWLWEVWHV